MRSIASWSTLAVFIVFSVAAIAALPDPAHADITTGLVGYWKFDEGTGTQAGDSSGNGNTVT
jgi:hypothetical protein